MRLGGGTKSMSDSLLQRVEVDALVVTIGLLGIRTERVLSCHGLGRKHHRSYHSITITITQRELMSAPKPFVFPHPNPITKTAKLPKLQNSQPSGPWHSIN